MSVSKVQITMQQITVTLLATVKFSVYFTSFKTINMQILQITFIFSDTHDQVTGH